MVGITDKPKGKERIRATAGCRGRLSNIGHRIKIVFLFRRHNARRGAVSHTSPTSPVARREVRHDRIPELLKDHFDGDSEVW
jgi:hypothetical protein